MTEPNTATWEKVIVMEQFPFRSVAFHLSVSSQTNAPINSTLERKAEMFNEKPFQLLHLQYSSSFLLKADEWVSGGWGFNSENSQVIKL